jgi:hypothetical protein
MENINDMQAEQGSLHTADQECKSVAIELLNRLTAMHKGAET